MGARRHAADRAGAACSSASLAGRDAVGGSAASIGKAWLALYAGEMRQWHGALPSLAVALIGFAATLLFGVLHAGGILAPPAPPTPSFSLPFSTGYRRGKPIIAVWPARPANPHGTRKPGKNWGWRGIRGLLFLAGASCLVWVGAVGCCCDGSAQRIPGPTHACSQDKA